MFKFVSPEDRRLWDVYEGQRVEFGIAGRVVCGTVKEWTYGPCGGTTYNILIDGRDEVIPVDKGTPFYSPK